MKKLMLLPPPVIALILLGTAYLVSKNPPNVQVVSPSTGGLAWLIAGAGLILSAAWQFRQFQTTVMPQGTPTQLITYGAYLWTRNPMYLGILTTLIGIAFYEGTLSYWMVPPAFFLVINGFQIPYEEEKLVAIFGKEYERYARNVRRWL